jgi:hypothetical protein
MTIRAVPGIWRVEGSYFEACNCEAICPCRRHGDYAGGRSTFGVCDFALSWFVRDGDADGVDLRDLGVVLAGSYGDDEPDSPWRVVLYVDDRADEKQASALADIFLGRAGGATVENYAAAIGEVYAVRTATIRLTHSGAERRIHVDDYVEVWAVEEVASEAIISCAIPGHDRPGAEMRARVMRVRDEPLSWELAGRCAFRGDFSYSSDS